MTLYIYATGEAVRNLSAAEVVHYLAMLAEDGTHTGVVPGAAFGLPGVNVYAV